MGPQASGAGLADVPRVHVLVRDKDEPVDHHRGDGERDEQSRGTHPPRVPHRGPHEEHQPSYTRCKCSEILVYKEMNVCNVCTTCLDGGNNEKRETHTAYIFLPCLVECRLFYSSFFLPFRFFSCRDGIGNRLARYHVTENCNL